MTDEPTAIDAEQARLRAERFLSTLADEFETELAWFDGAFGVATVSETDGAWIYRWNSAEYVRTGNIMDQILVGAIVVPKNGSEPWVFETGEPEDVQLQRHASS